MRRHLLGFPPPPQVDEDCFKIGAAFMTVGGVGLALGGISILALAGLSFGMAFIFVGFTDWWLNG